MGRLLGVVLVLMVSVTLCLADDAPYVQQLRELADQGDGESRFALALLSEYGEQGVERDPQRAFALFLQAGQAGIPAACLYLGIKYENGSGVVRDPAQAGRWYCCAAKEGWAMAQFFLAGLYEQGKGVSQDKALALAWYGLAAEQGYPGAKEAVVQLTAELAESGRDRAVRIRSGLQVVDCAGL